MQRQPFQGRTFKKKQRKDTSTARHAVVLKVSTLTTENSLYAGVFREKKFKGKLVKSTTVETSAFSYRDDEGGGREGEAGDLGGVGAPLREVLNVGLH